MNNKIMFFIGLTIFVVYMYFLLSIITKQHKLGSKRYNNITDENDFDGIGNQGRVPNKRN